MSKESKWMLAALAAVALAVAWPVAASADGSAGSAAATPTAVHAGTRHNLLDLTVDAAQPDRPRIRLSVDGAAEFEAFVLEDPERLVIDMQGVVSRLERYKFPVEYGGVIQARAGQHQLEPVPVTRVVFDLLEALDHRVTREADALVVEFLPRSSAGQPGDSQKRHDEAEPHVSEHRTEAATAPDSVAAAPPRATDALEATIAALNQRSTAAPTAAGTTPAATGHDSAATSLAPQPEVASNRAVSPAVLDAVLRQPAFAAQAESSSAAGTVVAESASRSGFETRTIVTDSVQYTGKRISLNLVDADVKQIFRLFHDISGLNFVLDPSVGGRVTIVLDEVPWDQALDIILKNNGLDKVLENNVIRIATTQKLAQEAAARRQLKEAKELEVEPITITRTLSYGKAGDVERVIRDSGILTSRGKVIVDERTNTLIISDIPKKVEPLDVLISTLDSETPQVMIEARIVETSREFTQDLGVVWGMSAIADASRGTATRLGFPHNASARYGLNLPGDGGASNLAFKFGNVIDSFTLDVALNTLETEGRGRILSSPKIATQNNEKAEIEQGVRIPIVNTTATEINVEFVSASLKMTATPQITAEGTIILEVIVENNSPDFANTAGSIPTIRTQRAQTKVLINDGGTTVIGGIFTVNEGVSETGVPWFRKLPVFGWLFKTQKTSNQNRELLIFITPKIMRVA